MAMATCDVVDEPDEHLRAAEAGCDSDSDEVEFCNVKSGAPLDEADQSECGDGEAASSAAANPQHGSASSSTDRSGNPVPSKPKSQVIASYPDGSMVQAVYSGHGTSFCTVERLQAGTSKLLGEIKLLVQSVTGQETLRAICKLHGSNCQCWITNSKDSDLLLQWLAAGEFNSREEHQTLSLELRRSIGMKVRK